MNRGGGAGVLALTLLAAIGALTAMLMPWYGMTADGDTFFSGRGNTLPRGDGQPAFPPIAVDVPLYPPAVIEGIGQIAFDPDEAGHLEQVTRTTRFAWTLGAIVLTGTIMGLAARCAGHREHHGLVAGLGLVALVLLTFGTIQFATGVADGLNDALEERYGQSPDLAFFTFDGPPSGTESQIWADVDSAPGPGWWAALVTLLALGGALVWSYLPTLRDIGQALGSEPRPGASDLAWSTHARSGTGSPSGRSATVDRDGRHTGETSRGPRDFHERIRRGGAR